MNTESKTTIKAMPDGRFLVIWQQFNMRSGMKTVIDYVSEEFDSEEEASSFAAELADN